MWKSNWPTADLPNKLPLVSVLSVHQRQELFFGQSRAGLVDSTESFSRMSTAGETKISDTQLAVRVQSGDVELLEALAADWRNLCDETGDEIFYRPEWTLAYLRAFAPRTKLTVLTAWAGERLRGILPLVRERAWFSGLPATRLTLPANVHCFRIGLAVAPGEEGDRVLRALWQSVQSLPDWSVLDVSHVVEGHGMDRLAAVARSQGFPVARKRTSQTLYLPINTSSSSSNAKDQPPPWM